MEREKRLIKSTIIIAIGKISTQFISFFLLPLYTALLSAEEFGVVDLLNTYILLLIPLFFLQIDQASFRFLIDLRNSPEEQHKIISTTIITTIFQSILYLILFFILSFFVNSKYQIFLATNVIVSCFANLFLQISRGLGDNKSYSIGSLIAGAGTIVLNVIFIALLHLGAYGILLATLLSNIFCILYLFLKKKIYRYLDRKDFDKEELKKMLKFSIPLVPNQLSWWIINASDRMIVSKILGLAANGIYSAANKFSSICITIFNIFNLTWSESASISINDQDKELFYSKVLNTVYSIFSSLCFLVIGIMPFCFEYLISGQEYQAAFNQIPILLISTLFNIIVSLLGSIYIALKKSNEIAKTSFYAAIINIATNLILIRYIGLYAASISTLVAYSAMAIYRYINIQKYVKIKLKLSRVILSVITVLILIACYYQQNLVYLIIGLIISIIYSIYTCQNIIIKIPKYLKNILQQKM